jgi:uncharacterized protein
VKRVQDPVHGLMEFRGMESFAVEALRTAEVQRLRRIRQLGLVYLVFPGGEHSRFVHSLGASFVAARFGRSLELTSRELLPESLRADEEVVRDLVLAALCHDLGHGPLSHPWEQQLIGLDYSQDDWAAALGLASQPWIRQKMRWHELVAQALLLWSEGELNRLLEALETGTSQRIAALLRNDYYLPYLTRLLASDVDADRCDFVLRDAYQTGVAHGRYDIDWLVSTVTVGTTEQGSPVVGFDSAKAPRVVEQLLVARRALCDTVYHHPRVRSAEGMVGLIFARLKSHHDELLHRVRGFQEIKKAIRNEPLSPVEILRLDDHNLWVFIQTLASNASTDAATDLANRVLKRRLFRAVPIDSMELQEFLNDDPPRATIVVDNAIERAGYETPSSYRIWDSPPFAFFHGTPTEGSLFVSSSSDRRAYPVRDHPELLLHRSRDERSRLRLFVPDDAVEEVASAISRNRQTRRNSGALNESPETP